MDDPRSRSANRVRPATDGGKAYPAAAEGAFRGRCGPCPARRAVRRSAAGGTAPQPRQVACRRHGRLFDRCAVPPLPSPRTRSGIGSRRPEPPRRGRAANRRWI